MNKFTFAPFLLSNLFFLISAEAQIEPGRNPYSLKIQCETQNALGQLVLGPIVETQAQVGSGYDQSIYVDYGFFGDHYIYLNTAVTKRGNQWILRLASLTTVTDGNDVDISRLSRGSRGHLSLGSKGKFVIESIRHVFGSPMVNIVCRGALRD